MSLLVFLLVCLMDVGLLLACLFACFWIVFCFAFGLLALLAFCACVVCVCDCFLLVCLLDLGLILACLLACV